MTQVVQAVRPSGDERWDRVKECFLAALERPRIDRAAFVRELCGEDDALVSEVETLLEAHLTADPLLDAPAACLLADDHGSLIGKRIGSYEITKEVGVGGMGMVYLATRADGEYSKCVAIKMMAGAFLGAPARERFRSERQILSKLDHPNIARLLDGGTTRDGVPFIIMEYVEGEPIDVYCRERALSVGDRIRLLLAACSAVQYAHRNLVVHRDLKPANILVNGDGQPKLLDFGIAKLLDPTGELDLHTATEQRVMTPAYASPEQMLGRPISTASDVYSLGVLLYELLAGVRPYEMSGALTLDAVRVVCEQEPARPSTAARAAVEADSRRRAEELRGDLDRIILKALRKEPEARYVSVEHLIEDLHRYLDGRPVLAQPPTLRYRATKFARRYRTAVAAVVVVTLSLAGSTIYSVRQASIAQAESDRATQEARLARARFDDVRELSHEMLFKTHDALVPIPGSLEVRQSLTRNGLRYLDRLAEQSEKDSDLMSELALGYQKLGSVTYGVPEALRSHRKAVEIHERLVRDHPSVHRYREGLSSCLASLANLLKLAGDRAGELAGYERARVLTKELIAQKPESREYRLQLKGLCDDIGRSKARQGRVKEGIEDGRVAVALARGLAAAPRGDEAARRALVVSLHLLGTSLIEAGDLDGALSNYREAQSIIFPLSRANPTNNIYRRDLWYVHRSLGSILSRQGGHDEAVEHLRISLGLKEALLAADPADAGHHRGLAITHMAIGDAASRNGDHQRAHDHYSSAIAISEGLLLNDPGNRETWDDLRAEFAGIQAILSAMKRSSALPAVQRREQALYREAQARQLRQSAKTE